MPIRISTEALHPKWDQSRREECNLVSPNKRQQGELCLHKRESPGGVTQSGAVWGAALRDGPFFRSAALWLTDVQQAQGAHHALQKQKNGRVAATEIRMGIS